MNKKINILFVESFVVRSTFLLLAFSCLWSFFYSSEIEFVSFFLFFLCNLIFVSLVGFSKIIFSPVFWLLLSFDLYYVLGAFVYEPATYLLEAYHQSLFLCSLFFVFLMVAFVFFKSVVISRKLEMCASSLHVINPRRLVFISLTMVFLSLVYSYFLSSIFSSGGTHLERSLETQNNGVTYLFRITNFFNIVFYYLLAYCFLNRKKLVLVSFVGILMFIYYIISENRAGAIILLFSYIYMYNTHIKHVKLLPLICMSPLVLFVFIYIGYVRNFSGEDISFYLDVFGDMVHDLSFMVKLFIARLDVFPSLVMGVYNYQQGNIEPLYGSSLYFSVLHSIPRNIWEGKPLLTSALVTSINYPGLFADGVNVYCSAILEGFINLELFGVVIWAILIGIFSGFFYNIHIKGYYFYSVLVLSLFTFPMGLLNEGFHSNYTSVFLMQLIYVFVWLKVLKWLGVLSV
ncbi:O-antigen polymerase [Aeromonas veronii]|uniref:O-antigen polymerase n=1 Tax=Aeromonas veronii TaxID=654 RepID=UPI003F743738